MKILVTASALACLIVGSPAFAEKTPDNAALFKMIMELQAQQAQLKKEVQAAKKEVQAAKKEAAVAKSEAAQAKTELARVKENQTAATGQTVLGTTGGGFERADKKSDRFYAGVELAYVQPVFDQAVVGADDSVDLGNGTNDLRVYSMDHDAAWVPKLFAGYEMSNGLGVRGSIFNLDVDSSFSQPEGPSGSLDVDFDLDDDDLDLSIDDTLIAKDELDVWAADFEVYKKFGNDNSGSLTIGAGIRYADVERHIRLWDSDDPANQVRAWHDIEGIGPRLSIAAKYPVYKGVRLFASAAGSLIYADEEQRLDEIDGGSFNDINEIDDKDKIMPILEASLGLEWQASKSTLFRASVEGQRWINGGGWHFAQDDSGNEYPGDASWSSLGVNFSAEMSFD